MKSIGLGLFVLMTAALAGCGADAQSTSSAAPEQNAAFVGPLQPIPTTTGTFRGHYVVPVPSNLAAAATFSVDEVSWSVSKGIATLSYYLPVGLVGGTLEVEFTGWIRPGATSVALRSASGGTATCTAVETTITCHENFGDLGALPISMDVVRKRAAEEYAGSAEDRVAVANVFSSDPIGFVDFDVTAASE